MKHSKGQNLVCPHCGKAHDTPVEDYVVPNSLFGIPHRDACEWCYKKLWVVQLDDTSFDVKANNG